MNQVVHNERGMALAVAIFMLVIVGALVAGALFIGTQDQRSSENTRRLHQSFGIAEYGAFDQVRNWANVWQTLSTSFPAAGSTTSVAKTAIANRGSYSGKIYRMNTSQFLVDITGGDTLSQTGNVPSGGARQRVGVIMRATPSAPPINATIATRGGTGQIRGAAQPDGLDNCPPSWTGCTLQAGLPGFSTNDTTAYKANGNTFKKVVGNPPVVQDPTLTPAKMDTLGSSGLSYSDMVARATITLPGGSYPAMAPVIVGGVCNTAVLTNWGSPLTPAGACGTYFPIIHITGDLTITGATTQGQGILLVDGNFNVNDGNSFVGMIMIQGSIVGVHHFAFYGAMQVKNPSNSFQDVFDIEAHYSSTALATAFGQLAVTAAPMRSRSWAELY